MAASNDEEPQPFDTLDHDWALLCHQHRRSRTVAGWAQTEAALAGMRQLADVIPPVGADRTPIAGAFTRLYIAGDDLAGRVLLQLLVPGLIRLTALWRTRLGGVCEAGWEIITRASLYIGWLREGDINCGPAGYILRSVHRDLTLEAQADEHESTARIDLGPGIEVHHGHRLVDGSAEDAFFGATVVRLALEDAARAGIIPLDCLEPIWLTLIGQSVPEAFQGTGYPQSTAYRHRAQAFAYLHRHLYAPGEASER